MPECDLKWLDQLRLNQTEVRPQAYACHCYVMYTHYCLYSTEKLKNCFYGSDSAFCASISWHHITQRDHSSEDTNIWRQLCVQPRGDLEGQSLADLAVPSLYVVCIFFSSSSNHLDSPCCLLIFFNFTLCHCILMCCYIVLITTLVVLLV